MAVWRIQSLQLSRMEARYMAGHMTYGVVWEQVYGMLEKHSGTVHWKLGFLKLAERAAGHRAEKRAAVQELRPVSDVCQTLVQKCDAHKALILAIGQDKSTLASRRAARLIAARQSAAAVLEDMSKAIQVKCMAMMTVSWRALLQLVLVAAGCCVPPIGQDTCPTRRCLKASAI